MVGQLTESRLEYYSEILKDMISDKTLLVVSSDFCHWGDKFDYYYLSEKLNSDDKTVSNQIKKLDMEAIYLINKLDA
jgi:AmmeMemoRadiSam system protein B